MKTFSQAHILKNHKAAVHDKIRPYKCDVCEKLFILFLFLLVPINNLYSILLGIWQKM